MGYLWKIKLRVRSIRISQLTFLVFPHSNGWTAYTPQGWYNKRWTLSETQNTTTTSPRKQQKWFGKCYDQKSLAQHTFRTFLQSFDNPRSWHIVYMLHHRKWQKITRIGTGSDRPAGGRHRKHMPETRWMPDKKSYKRRCGWLRQQTSSGQCFRCSIWQVKQSVTRDRDHL